MSDSQHRPSILDLFCGAGGAAMGYHRAGFKVVGVDINPQPNYPFEFIRMNAFGFSDPRLFALFAHFDAIHASPPCQFGTAYKRRPGVAEDAENLIPPTRELLERAGLPYVIENVDTNMVRPHMRDPIRLCGSSFGLDVQRHRLFETSWPIGDIPTCNHGWTSPRFPGATNRTNLRKTIEVGVWRIPLRIQQLGMGIDWMELHGLTEAIPPAYTEFIGRRLMAHLEGITELTGEAA